MLCIGPLEPFQPIAGAIWLAPRLARFALRAKPCITPAMTINDGFGLRQDRRNGATLAASKRPFSMQQNSQSLRAFKYVDGFEGRRNTHFLMW
jgi:hypothetical protein